MIKSRWICQWSNSSCRDVSSCADLKGGVFRTTALQTTHAWSLLHAILFPVSPAAFCATCDFLHRRKHHCLMLAAWLWCWLANSDKPIPRPAPRPAIGPRSFIRAPRRPRLVRKFDIKNLANFASDARSKLRRDRNFIGNMKEPPRGSWHRLWSYRSLPGWRGDCSRENVFWLARETYWGHSSRE